MRNTEFLRGNLPWFKDFDTSVRMLTIYTFHASFPICCAKTLPMPVSAMQKRIRNISHHDFQNVNVRPQMVVIRYWKASAWRHERPNANAMQTMNTMAISTDFGIDTSSFSMFLCLLSFWCWQLIIPTINTKKPCTVEYSRTGLMWRGNGRMEKETRHTSNMVSICNSF